MESGRWLQSEELEVRSQNLGVKSQKSTFTFCAPTPHPLHHPEMGVRQFLILFWCVSTLSKAA